MMRCGCWLRCRSGGVGSGDVCGMDGVVVDSVVCVVVGVVICCVMMMMLLLCVVVLILLWMVL